MAAAIRSSGLPASRSKSGRTCCATVTTSWRRSCSGARKPRPSGDASRCACTATTAGTAASLRPSPAAICSRSRPGPISSAPGAAMSCSSGKPDRTSRSKRGKARELLGELTPHATIGLKRRIERVCREFDRTSDLEPAARCRAGRGRRVRCDLRGDLTRSVPIPVVVDRPRARAGAWYEMVPRSQGTCPGPPRHLRRLHRAAAGDRRARLRRGLSHADPSDRQDQPQGAQQHAARRAGRSRQPLCHRQRGRRP